MAELAPDEPELASSNGATAHRPSIDDRLAAPRRRWPALLAGVAVGVGGTIVVTEALSADSDSADDPAAAPTEAVLLDTVEVGRRDLVDEVEWAGELASGATSSVAAPRAGTLTAALDAGATVSRGTVIARIDDRPLVAMFGAMPMWRDLAVGDVGDDVRQLETNLSVLGFDPEGDITIDDEYTTATGEMVEAWQLALGVEATGEVLASDVVFVAGEAVVSIPLAVGSTVQPGVELLRIETPAAGYDVVAAAVDDDVAGVIDDVIAAGTPVAHGSMLYTVDGAAALAIVDRPPETLAVLDAIEQGDVELLESVLASTGFDPENTMVIDDVVDAATEASINRWQASAGLPPTGSAQAATYVVVPGDREYVAAEPSTQPGEAIGEGRLVTTLVSSTLTLHADVVVTEIDEFAIGDVVAVEQVDETTFTAVVTAISETTTETGGDGAPTVEVSFDVVDPPESFVSGSVTITTESSRIDDALVVPTRALVTLREGGFAVEVANADGSRTLVGVELGVFDDGVVEIVDGDLDAGDAVVVPS